MCDKMANTEYSECKEVQLNRDIPDDQQCLQQRHHYGFVNKTKLHDVDITTVRIMLKTNQTIETILKNPIRFGEVLYINAYGTIMFAFLQFPKEHFKEFDNYSDISIECLEEPECVIFKNPEGKVCLMTRHSLQGDTLFKAIEKHITDTKESTVTVSFEEFNAKAPITEDKNKSMYNAQACRKKLNNKSDQNEFSNNKTSIHKYHNNCYSTSHVALPPESVISLICHKRRFKVLHHQIPSKVKPQPIQLKMQPLQRPLKVQPPQVSVVCFAYPLYGAQHNKPAIPSYSTQVTEENGPSEITPSFASLPYGQYGEVGNRAEQSLTPLNQTPSHRQNISTHPTPVSTSQPVDATNTPNGLRTNGYIRGNTIEHGSHSRALSPNVSAEPRPPARHPDYRDHYPRLLSFTNWPGHVRQDPTHLCQAGFFYTGNADLVRCFQCGIGLKDFRPDDEPLIEHVRYSADCYFLLELLGPAQLCEYKRNVLGDNSSQGTFQQQQRLQEQPQQRQSPNVGAYNQYNGHTSQPIQQPPQVTTPYRQAPRIGPNDLRSTAMNHTSVTNQHYTTATSQQEIQQLGQHGHIPPDTAAGVTYRHPEYASLDTRLASFAKWPPGIMQTPRQIAEAGFYYTGMGDVVRCWACDGGLQKWDPQDDPWIEHCFYFPTCPYAIQQKGSGYIALVQQQARGNKPGERNQTPASNPSASTPDIHNDLQKLTIEEHDPVISTVAVQSLLEMGYDDKKIRRAIEKLKRQGTTDPSAEQIVDIIEEGNESIPLNNNSQSTEMHRTTSEVLHENERLKSLLLCMTCNENNVNVLFLPCTHHKMCTICAKTVTHCPLCNRFIQEKVKTYMS